MALWIFGKLPIVLSTKVNLLYLLYSMAQSCSRLHLIKQNCLLKTFIRTQILVIQVSLYLFSLLELIWNCIIFPTPKIIKKVITNFGLSKAFGLDYIPLVVLRKSEPELSYILAELLNKCLKEPCFPDCWKVLLVVPKFKNVGERSAAKNYCPVSLISVFSKVF